MTLSTVRIESEGSYWLIDEDAGRYVRTPKVEGPRERGPNGEDWGGPGARRGLQDATWHDMYGWEVRDVISGRLLIIYTDPDREYCVSAPVPYTVPLKALDPD